MRLARIKTDLKKPLKIHPDKIASLYTSDKGETIIVFENGEVIISLMSEDEAEEEINRALNFNLDWLSMYKTYTDQSLNNA